LSQIVSVDGVRVRYGNSAVGVDDVSLRVDAGQVVVIFGPNGAGKTTTVRAISGFLKSEKAKIVNGRISLFDWDATNAEPQVTMRHGVAFVPERDKIFPNLSVSENLRTVGRRPPRARRREIHERIHALFPMLAQRQRHLAGTLSGGQQQMLAIGRALMCEPRLLIIDEMTLGLHPGIHGLLFDAVTKIAADGTAIMIVDESTSLALEVADYCYLLGAGRVKLEGTPEKFRTKDLLAMGYVDAHPS
jgi:branched-chain amino acid transport system ATP-binding protein